MGSTTSSGNRRVHRLRLPTPGWLADGRFRSETEALIVAIQDGGGPHQGLQETNFEITNRKLLPSVL